MTEVNVDAAVLAKMIADGVSAALAANKTQRKSKTGTKAAGRKPMTDDEKAARRAAVDVETTTKFTAAGFKDVKPRETVRTYNKWIEVGRMVKKGQKSIKCGSFPLFHIEQTDVIGTQH